MRAPRLARLALLSLVLATASSCKRRPPASGSGALGIDAALTRARQLHAVELPAGGGHARECPSVPALALSSKFVTLDSDQAPVTGVPADLELGFGARDKLDGRDGLWVAPIHLALRGATPPPVDGARGSLEEAAARLEGVDEPRLALAADRRTTARALIEIAHTADVASASSVALVVDDGGRRRCHALHDARTFGIPPRLPRRQTLVDPPSRPTLDLAVALRADGFDLTAARRPVAPGCDDVGDGRTVPHVQARPDYAALTTCAKKLRESAPELTHEKHATIAAPEGTTLGELAPVLDALAAAGLVHATLVLPEGAR